MVNGSRERIPQFVSEVLEDFNCTILSTPARNAMSHMYVEFRTPNGQVRKWTWPEEKRVGYRVMKNNRSQLRNFLRKII